MPKEHEPTTKHPVPSGGREYKVKTNETLVSIARANGISEAELNLYNFGTTKPPEINWYLKNRVGCTKATHDGKNWMFTTDARQGKGTIYLPPVVQGPAVPGVTATAGVNLNNATQRGTYENIDAAAVTKGLQGPVELLGGRSVGYFRWLEIQGAGAIRESSGKPPASKLVSVSNPWITYADRPRLLILRQGWTFQTPSGESLRDYYVEVWWRPFDDLEYRVLESHANNAANGNMTSYGLVMRPFSKDIVLFELARREALSSFVQGVGLLVVSGVWRASLSWRMAPQNRGSAGVPSVPRAAPSQGGKIIVTEQMIRDAVKYAPLKTQQRGGVSIPRVQDFVDRLMKGDKPPPIKVDNGIIVDGNHRYIAGRIAGNEAPVQPWAGGNPNRVVPWSDLKVDPNRWAH
jgi:hypothetical protein